MDYRIDTDINYIPTYISHSRRPRPISWLEYRYKELTTTNTQLFALLYFVIGTSLAVVEAAAIKSFNCLLLLAFSIGN